MTGFEVWMWLKLDALIGLLIGLGVASFGVAVVTIIATYMTEDNYRWRSDCEEEKANLMRIRRWFGWLLIPIGLLLLILGTAVPTTKQYAVMRVLPEVTNSEFVQEDLPGDGRALYDAFRDWATRQLEKGGEKGEGDPRKANDGGLGE